MPSSAALAAARTASASACSRSTSGGRNIERLLPQGLQSVGGGAARRLLAAAERHRDLGVRQVAGVAQREDLALGGGQRADALPQVAVAAARRIGAGVGIGALVDLGDRQRAA